MMLLSCFFFFAVLCRHTGYENISQVGQCARTEETGLYESAEERAAMTAGRKLRNARCASPKQARQRPPLRPCSAAAPESLHANRPAAFASGHQQPQKQPIPAPATDAAAAVDASRDAEGARSGEGEEAMSSGSARGSEVSDGSGASAASSAARRRHSLADVRRAIAAQAQSGYNAFPIAERILVKLSS